MKTSKDKLIIAILLLITFYGIWYYPGYYPFPQLTSQAVGFVLRFVGVDAVALGSQMVLNFDNVTRTVAVSADCSGFLIMMVFLLTIFISPGFGRRQKLTAFIVVPIILAGNIMRIFIAIMLGRAYGIDAMLVFHNTVGNVMIFILATLCYFIWLHAVGEKRPPAQSLDFSVA